ncbi:hypothetical protein C0Q70_19473 [Pomacea canaliculata]|uniref:EGF-like domain-containing protein n=1 Tax=Pomacea canaliculata TaxID=400727 RepID=A0A2T7NJF7_POMCA|nr:hypothetical protein C0Q70_19473 [Pomacea canaliculata]
MLQRVCAHGGRKTTGAGRKFAVQESRTDADIIGLRLYWVDAKKKNIASCDIDGGDITVERDLSSTTTAFGLVVIGNKAIISTWFTAKILSAYVATRNALWTEELSLPGSSELFSLVATAPSMQPPSFHPCGQEDKGGCSHLCLPTRGTSYRCACPSYGGHTLSFSAKSCEAPSELLFFTLKESGEVGFISLTGAQSHDLTLAGRSKHPSAVTYDPIEQVVYWSDVKEYVIYRASLAGGEREMFLNSSHGIGIVDGKFAFDWHLTGLLVDFTSLTWGTQSQVWMEPCTHGTE